ncbi:hypothetical protein CWE13_02935 [Aliidiomarina shirensis]|uniref:Uncharacterized protein n=1 Tax=Aliidiomarina shirensis TaxID=1048642 RepID=A0A432WXY8_9GAMM|nr:hypothetical protein [Aliidiomarina shirensis]RUO38616.1 hypothetical protein CWE13_02935 [Aliidiomarina shirensis]
MDINVTLIVPIMFLLMLFVGVPSYYLGRRKTQTPVLAGLLGVVLCIIPPLAFLYLIVLVIKQDVPSKLPEVNG